MRSDRPAPILVEHAPRELPEWHRFAFDVPPPEPCFEGARFTDELFRERRISSVEWELLRGAIWPRSGRDPVSLLDPLPIDLIASQTIEVNWTFEITDDAPLICREAWFFSFEAHERSRLSIIELRVLLAAIWPRDRTSGLVLAKVKDLGGSSAPSAEDRGAA